MIPPHPSPKRKTGTYTDLQYVAIQTYAAPPAPLGVARNLTRRPSTNHHDLTAAQVATIRKLRAQASRGGCTGCTASVDPARSLAAYFPDQARCTMKPALLGLTLIILGACRSANGGGAQTPAPGPPTNATVHELLASNALVGRMVEVTGRCLGYSSPTVARGIAAGHEERLATGRWRRGDLGHRPDA
mgnify:CR=1 FL=1